ncbi:uncharacterized protein EV154DRAFT_490022 [Mucor mucedo]|uniref:uncharacterized protein n=1 Tax=Mucor mucedo TaxID=29922 RepID=UPI00221EED8D|nr:uncharacterized protein EV154DRAFT_490022 [Mucor mucedo]KAI7896967.1 hypothetical protein EV154DRAFT_490022 [Mucor mucedo]
MNNNQSSAIDIPPKVTRIVASTTPDGHSMLSSIVTDNHGHQAQRQSATTDTGISPTYYTSGGAPVNTDHSHAVGSPVYGDQSRVFFSHNSTCSCLGSGVGCECSNKCSC